MPKLKNLLPEIGILKDTNKAVARILTAIEKKESVCVFGDYDVDGLTSTAMLILFFKELGLDVEYYIPDRIDEGYGPNVKAMEKIAKNNTLLICVDCGVNAFEPLEKAKELGLDVVVFDHHKSAEKLPECVACVNPNRIDEESLPNDLHCLCACGVSFLFLMALNKESLSLTDTYAIPVTYTKKHPARRLKKRPPAPGLRRLMIVLQRSLYVYYGSPPEGGYYRHHCRIQQTDHVYINGVLRHLEDEAQHYHRDSKQYIDCSVCKGQLPARAHTFCFTRAQYAHSARKAVDRSQIKHH